jgi:hypothetical protein
MPEIVTDSARGIYSEMKCIFIVNKGCTHTQILGVSKGKNAKDSDLTSLEAMQGVLLYLSYLTSMRGVIENTSHSTATLPGSPLCA